MGGVCGRVECADGWSMWMGGVLMGGVCGWVECADGWSVWTGGVC